jgi:hypothetical protein
MDSASSKNALLSLWHPLGRGSDGSGVLAERTQLQKFGKTNPTEEIGRTNPIAKFGKTNPIGEMSDKQ